MTLADQARGLNSRARAREKRRHGRSSSKPPLPALILVTDDVRLPDPRGAVARLPRGAAVILRHYAKGADERERLARDLRRITRRHGLLLLIAAAGDGMAAANLARAVGADGLHLPEHLLRHGAWRNPRARKPGWLITAAAHSLPALRRAARAGLDAALLAPVFVTASHPGTLPLGLLRFAAWTRAVDIAAYALGGIDDTAAARLRPTRAYGIAGISGLVNAPAATRRPRLKGPPMA